MTVQIDDRDERTNVITSVNRVQGELARAPQRKEFDGIQTIVDININEQNSEPRFSANDMNLFLQHAMSIGDRLMSEIEEKLSG